MRPTILRIAKLSKTFGGVVATDELSLDVEQGELHAIIGPNGAGKTTLIAQLSVKYSLIADVSFSRQRYYNAPTI